MFFSGQNERMNWHLALPLFNGPQVINECRDVIGSLALSVMSAKNVGCHNGNNGPVQIGKC